MRTTYVLGAGASAPSRAPVVRNFPAAAHRALQAPMPVQERDRFRATLQAWRKSGMTIEEYYVLCETAEAAGIQGPFGHVPPRNVQWLIAKTLQEALRSNEESPGRRAYGRFVSDAAGPEAIMMGCTVVSLNWDTCLETAAHGLGQGVNLPFKHRLTADEDDVAEIDAMLWDTLPLVKLHGSMNWWFCTKCQALITSGVEKGIVQHIVGPEQRACGECGEPALPAMVPPSSAKLDPRSPLHPLLSTMWLHAAAALAHAQRVVLIGYSLPDADLQFRLLLRATLAKKATPVIIVTRRQTDVEALQREYAAKLGVEKDRVQVYDDGYVNWVSRNGPGYPPRNEMNPWWTG